MEPGWPNSVLTRPITSYAKVQAAVGLCIRNRAHQLHAPRVRQRRYLDIGCGANIHEQFINLDYLWRPGVDVCWDIQRGLPFPSASMLGVFSEHCLEHFPLAAAASILRECFRVLAPGGRLRLIVPDAELYVRSYVRRLDGDDSARLPFAPQEAFGAEGSPLLSVNRVFYQDRESFGGHCFMYDFDLLSRLLPRCGFNSVGRAAFQHGECARLLIDSAGRADESLYVEATKAASRH